MWRKSQGIRLYQERMNAVSRKYQTVSTQYKDLVKTLSKQYENSINSVKTVQDSIKTLS